MKKIIPFNLFILVIIATAAGQQQLDVSEQPNSSAYPIINTDRPTQAYSPYLIPRQTFQIETGCSVENESNNTDDITRYDIAGTQFRYGVFDNFEIRASGYYRVKEVSPKETAPDSTVSGFGPIRLGFKVHIVEEKGWRPELAVIANITLRHFGQENYTPTYSYPTASLLAANTLGPHFSLVYNAGFAYSGKNADGFFIYRVALNYALTDKLFLFIEPYGNLDHGDLPNHKIDGGIMLVLRQNFQLDASYGFGVSKDVDKSFVSLGLSWRLPH